MTTFSFKNIAPEDIEESLKKVERSFGIEIAENELSNVKTFGEFCDYISNKIELENQDSCTTQQAFYKLRQAICTTLYVDEKIVIPNLPLNQILPKKNRRHEVKKIEDYLGFKLNILCVSNFTSVTLFIILLSSIVVMLFFNGGIGLTAVTFSIFCIWLSEKFDTSLKVNSIGEVAEKMTRENYLKSRRNSKTFNNKEIENILTVWFMEDLGFEKKELTRETEFS